MRGWGSRHRRLLFHRMHEALDDSRQQHGERVDALQEEARAARRRLAEVPIVRCRTWPFPIFEPAALDELAAEIRKRLSD